MRALADPASQSTDFNRPGHVATLRARPGGVTARCSSTLPLSIWLCLSRHGEPEFALCSCPGHLLPVPHTHVEPWHAALSLVGLTDYSAKAADTLRTS